ncbi:hypothetical protein ACLB2K_076399 [Fragaria x ananassa]
MLRLKHLKWKAVEPLCYLPLQEPRAEKDLSKHHLRSHGLLIFVDGSYPCPSPFPFPFEDDGTSSDNSGLYERWLEQDSSAICMVVNTPSADALTLVIECQTSREVWLTLKQRYAFVSEFHIMQLKSTLQTIQKGSDSIDKYLLRFKCVRDKLAAAEVTMNDQDVKNLIIAGLPIEYSHARQIIRGKKDIGMEEVRSLLLSAEFKIELKHKQSTLYSLTGMIAQNNMTVRQAVLIVKDELLLKKEGRKKKGNKKKGSKNKVSNEEALPLSSATQDEREQDEREQEEWGKNKVSNEKPLPLSTAI